MLQCAAEEKMTRIVFMGTPQFAVPVLDALTQTPYSVIAVYTQPDRPAGRGQKLQRSPVKEYALAHALTVIQPRTFRDSETVGALAALSPDIIVVAAYGLILPPSVLAIPPQGSVNTHASLLPRHRGAAPVMAAILAGDTETGVTLMQMEAGLDTGPIFVQRSIPIGPEDTTGSLTMKLANLAADLLRETLPHILAGKLIPQPQDSTRATVFKTIRKDEGLIDWSLPSEDIARRVRAFNPWPSAFTFWKGTQLRILSARAEGGMAQGEPGQIITVADGAAVVTGRGRLILKEVQLAGKRLQSIEEFLRGHRDFLSSRLG
jgi:methionyl-tRNA formyltransferase